MKILIMTTLALAVCVPSSMVRAQSSTSSSALFDPKREPTTQVVRFTDADFSSAETLSVAYARLQAMAAKACDSEIRDLGVRAQDAACAREALDRAVRAVDRPRLTALHGGPAAIQLAARSDRF